MESMLGVQIGVYLQESNSANVTVHYDIYMVTLMLSVSPEDHEPVGYGMGLEGMGQMVVHVVRALIDNRGNSGKSIIIL